MKELMRLDPVILHNHLSDWLVALGLAVAITLALTLLKRLLIRKLSAIAGGRFARFDDAFVGILQATQIWLVAVIAACACSQYLELSVKATVPLGKLATAAAFMQVGLWISRLLDFWVNRSRVRSVESSVSAATSMTALSFVGRVILWSLILLLALENLGVNVTALVTSLGIGGIAVALAVQNILGDLFASLSIVIDKPFVPGDFIIVENYIGTVENIGLKTTRIRSVDGEQIIFSNSDLLKARLRNYKRMRERRVVFTLGVVKDTPVEQLEKIPEVIQKIVEAQRKVRFDRAHFKEVAGGFYNFEIIYWVLDPETGFYMDAQQAIKLATLRKISRETIATLQ